jgi:rhamnogalacturonan endolyase
MKIKFCLCPTAAATKLILLLGAMILAVSEANAQRQMEKLGRGVVAIRTNSTAVYVGWRMLGTDPEDIGFNLYRVPNGGAAVKVNSAPITNSCNYVDPGATLTQSNAWFVRPVTNGVEGAASAAFGLPANAPTQQYLSIPLQIPPGGTTPDGVVYTYSANDCSVGDLDGDGEYEIVVKWDPSNSKDNSQSGYTGDVYLDAYKLDGTRLWRIDLGKNIRAGAHYTQFMVYDLDGDGKAEVACKTAPGTIDGQTNYVLMPGDDSNADYRNSSGYILDGPEYLTIFNGQTGAAMVTTNYVVPRGNVSDWGDSYGNRVDRFLACVAYLDGVRPSLVMCRGYYTRAVLAAWDWRNGQLTQRWVFDSNNPGYSGYMGQGNHNLSVGDVDGDGRDEIVYGACAINHDGTGLYTTGLGHGDAMHLSDMDPDRPGLEVWDVHETPNPVSGGGEFRDAWTGQLLFGYPGTSDTGRGLASHIDPAHPGYQMWSSATDGTYDHTGVKISSSKPSVNFAIWWNASLSRDLLDGSNNDGGSTDSPHIDRWTGSGTVTELSATGCYANNYTKATPALTADILGDWREEAIWRTADSSALRIYTTTAVATNRFYTLMHDPQYRLSIAWQNTAYNQPPHTGFYIGETMFPPPRAPISDADLAWRGGSGGNAWDITTTSNWFVNGVWTNNALTTFAQGNSVLFDLRGSTNAAVNFAGALAPAKVTVFTSTNYTFAGSGSLTGAMKLYKTGSGRLTLSNTNTYTGSTFVSGGSLFVNGTLAGSAVTVERRGTPEGPSQFGGNGRLGQGLTVQNGCAVIVGPGTNSAGTLTVSNNLTELGNVLNLFDLSGDPTGTTKTNDRVSIIGNLTLTGTNIIAINQPDGSLGNGVYPLFQYTGTLTGGLTNLSLTGNFLQFVTLTNPPGMIGLLAVVPASPPVAPGNLTATAVSAVQINLGWKDNSTNENAFLIERSTNNVTFAQIVSVPAGTTNYSDFGLTPATTYYYRVRGTNLAGASDYSNTANATTAAISPSLTWRGDGTLNVWDVATTANWLNGTNLTFYADTAFVTFDNTGSNSPTINLSTNLYPGSVTVTGTKNYTFNGAGGLGGNMTLTKSGTSTLTISTTNTFTGGMTISNGTVALSGSSVGAYTANSYAPGSGAITFRGGRFALYGAGLADNTSGYGTFTNDLVIATGQTGTLLAGPRQTLSSKVTGAGTLNLFVDYVRGDVGGDWSGFTGLINVSQTTGTPPSSTTDDFRVTTTGGFPNARLNIGTNVVMYSRATAGSIIPIGEFSGAIGATVSASGGSGAGAQNAVTWRVGGTDTDATNAALIQGATSLIKEGSGTWTLTGTNTYSGTTTVNEGTLLVNGNQAAATSTVTVGASGMLGGTGVIGGAVTVNTGGVLAPGTGAGTLTISNNLTLSSGAVLDFELGAINASDKVVVSGALTLGGTLNVMNLTGFGTNTYTLLAYGGALSGTLPVIGVMPSGYTGSVNTNTPGQVKLVVQALPPNPPHFNSVGLVGTNLVMSGNGGTAGSNYYVLASTNLLLPLVQWTPIVTNQFGTNGGFNFTNGVNSGTPLRFYRLQVP